MGTWGTEIEANDTYADVEAAFLECLAENKTSKELYTHFIDESDFEEEISEETHDWWFAIADLFWKIGYLDKKVVEVVKTIIETKADLNYWIETDADEDDIKERAKVLKAFLKRIATPIKKPFSYDDFVNENELTKGDEIQQTPTNNEKQLSKEEENRAKKMWDEYIQRNLSVKDQNKLSFFTKFFTQFAKPKQPKSPNIPPEKPCFLAGTFIKTENGLIAIEKIETGTKVLSYNLDKQKTEYQTLLQTFTHFAEKYIEIHTESEVLEVTGAHLFYISDDQKWIAASQLTTAMHLMNANQQKIAIKALNIIKKEVPTYNIEVAENHNYFVGKNQSILTHNEAKKLKFTSEILYDFEFYEYLDYNNKPLYVGQTTQGIDVRLSQHFKDYEKFPNKKEFMDPQINSGGPRRIRINNNPNLIKVKMTPFEAAVTEMYELQLRGGKRTGELGLFNKKNPTARRTFDRIKKDFPNFNPCRFYV